MFAHLESLQAASSITHNKRNNSIDSYQKSESKRERKFKRKMESFNVPLPELNFIVQVVVVSVIALISTIYLFQRRTGTQHVKQVVTDSDAFTLRFNQVGKESVLLVGGKGANLGELCRAGFQVPDGFCVTSKAYRRQLEFMATLTPSDSNETKLNTAEEHSRMMHADIPEEVKSAIASEYRSLCRSLDKSGRDVMVAVRSSTTSEDSAEASFAGQLDTFLGVCGEEEVIRAVRECWASVHSARMMSYRSENVNKEISDTFACCVVVQQMLNADCAGVMFTANPLTNSRDQIVITGNWGLGESVVADMVTPDTWVCDVPRDSSNSTHHREVRIISIQIAKKENKVVLAELQKNSDSKLASSGCSVLVPVDDQHQQVACLSDEQVCRLASLGTKVAEYYHGTPQDVEWGMKDDKLYLLQSRPITTLKHTHSTTSSIGEFDTPCRATDWVTTCNAQEMFPGVATPLTISTFGEAANYAVQYLGMKIGSRSKADTRNRVLDWHGAHMFLNMTNTLAPMCASMIGETMTKENGEMSILGRVNTQCTAADIMQESNNTPRVIPMRMFNGMRYLLTMCTAHRLIPVMVERHLRVAKALNFSNIRTDTAWMLWNKIDGNLFEMRDQWADGILTSSTSAAFMLFVMKVLCATREEQWSPAAVGEVAILLGNDRSTNPASKNVAESADAIEALELIRDSMLKSPSSCETFCNLEPEVALAWLLPDHPLARKSEGNGEVQFIEASKLLKDTLERHGHRCVKEAEMRTLEWSADPLPLIRLLQSLLRAQAKSSVVVDSNSKDVHVTKKESMNQSYNNKTSSTKRTAESVIVSKSHLNFVSRWVLKKLVALTRAGVHRRELGKSLQVKCHTEFKRAYRELGRLMEEQNFLPTRDLIYFLTHQEIGQVLNPDTPRDEVETLVSKTIKRREIVPLQESLRFSDLYKGTPVPLSVQSEGDGSPGEEGAFRFVGTPVSAGLVSGKARIVKTLEEADTLQEGEILVCPFTDVGWTPYFSLAAGLVTEIGGMLSHGAVVAREYGLPCVVNLPGACTRIRNGQSITLDGDTGVLVVHSQEEAEE